MMQDWSRLFPTILVKRAFRYFHEREIAVYTGAAGKVCDTLRAYREGRLQSAADYSLCWGRHEQVPSAGRNRGRDNGSDG